MKEYLIQRLGITDTRKSSTALNATAQEGWLPVHFFRTVQGDLGVVFERESIVPEPEPQKKKRNGQKPEEAKSLVDELDDILDDPELVDGLKDLL
jgi:hypothetical protein